MEKKKCKACEEKQKKAAARKLRSVMQEPMHVPKRIRIPIKLHHHLRGSYDNVSAYIRSLIYKDQGMMEEYEREIARMEPVDN